VLIEQWTASGAGQAWSGRDPAGSHADAAGPSASTKLGKTYEPVSGQQTRHLILAQHNR
jgi:hypothetical protein